jgi:predicted ribosome quality control (RQC) complex YloA/Tae2 family protein
MIEIIKEDNIYKLGRNAVENFELIDNSYPEDWWFHLEDFPSGHCVISSIKNELFECSNEMKIFAGNLIIQYSKAKNINKVKIIFTQIKNLVKTKTVGQVIVKNGNYFTISK